MIGPRLPKTYPRLAFLSLVLIGSTAAISICVYKLRGLPHADLAEFAIIMAAFLPVGKLADFSNAGTLFAFAMVSISVMVLRKKDPQRRRPFRTPAVYFVAPAAIIGCIALYSFLPLTAILALIVWGAVGLLIYFGYSRSRSHVGRGITDVVPDPNLQPELAKRP